METKAVWVEASSRILSAVLLENSLKNEGKRAAWSEPLIGFSSGNDFLYGRFKDDIGDFYWTPPEIFKEAIFMLNLRVDGHQLDFTANRSPPAG